MTTIKTKHMIEREWDVVWRGTTLCITGSDGEATCGWTHESQLPPISDDFPAEVHAAAVWEIRANRPLAQNEWRDPETKELYAFEVNKDGTMVRCVGDKIFCTADDLAPASSGFLKAMRDYLLAHGRPSYIPEGSHWGWVTDGLGRRVGAYVHDGRFIRVRDSWGWWPDSGFLARVAALTTELSDQCQALWDSRPQGQPTPQSARAELLEQLQNVKEETTTAPAHARENYEQAKRAEERLGYLPQAPQTEQCPVCGGLGQVDESWSYGQGPCDICEGTGRIPYQGEIDASEVRERAFKALDRALEQLQKEPQAKSDEPPWLTIGEHGQPPEGSDIEFITSLGSKGVYADYTPGLLHCFDTKYRVLRSCQALKAVAFETTLNEYSWFGGRIDLPPGTPVHVVVTPVDKLGAK